MDAVSVEGDRLTLDPEESRHLLRVHRAPPGTPFEATDGAGTTYSCVLESEEGGLAVARVERRVLGLGETGVEVRLIVGLPEPGAAESVVEHAVPLGATVLDFAACERSGRPELGPARLERLLRLARSAVKQSRRCRLPEIRSSPSLEAALALVREAEKIVADPEGAPLVAAGTQAAQISASLAVGPPGGFTPGELDRLRGAGFLFISLGPSRLTTQTAALALLAAYRNSLLIRSLTSI